MSEHPLFQPPPTPTKPFVDCDFCREPIEEEDPAIELFEGQIGRSQRAGHLMVVQSQYSPTDRPAILHLECVVSFTREHICEPDYEANRQERYCDMCASKLDGEYE